MTFLELVQKVQSEVSLCPYEMMEEGGKRVRWALHFHDLLVPWDDGGTKTIGCSSPLTICGDTIEECLRLLVKDGPNRVFFSARTGKECRPFTCLAEGLEL